MGTKIGKHLGHIRHGLVCGRLPKGAAWIARDCDAFRRVIEAAVIEKSEDGGISVFQASVIQSAIRWERHAMLAQRWLRIQDEELTPDQRLSFSREVARASDNRDRCLKQLGLDRRQQADIVATLYTSQPTEKESE